MKRRAGVGKGGAAGGDPPVSCLLYTSCPSVETLPKLAELFRVSVDELMQVQSQTPPEAGCTERGEITVLALRAVALAMGVAVAVLSMMKQLDLNSGFTMLGVGLACGMLSLFGRKSR